MLYFEIKNVLNVLALSLFHLNFLNQCIKRSVWILFCCMTTESILYEPLRPMNDKWIAFWSRIPSNMPLVWKSRVNQQDTERTLWKKDKMSKMHCLLLLYSFIRLKKKKKNRAQPDDTSLATKKQAHDTHTKQVSFSCVLLTPTWASRFLKPLAACLNPSWKRYALKKVDWDEKDNYRFTRSLLIIFLFGSIQTFISISLLKPGKGRSICSDTVCITIWKKGEMWRKKVYWDGAMHAIIELYRTHLLSIIQLIHIYFF